MQTFVDLVVTDKWTGVLCDEDQIHSPSIADVERVVDALDSKTRTLLSLHAKDGAYLSVGGGAGQYVVYAFTSDEQLWNLLADSDDQRGVILLNAGGQEGDFPPKQMVDKHRALKAARTFSVTGQLDRALRWEKQT